MKKTIFALAVVFGCVNTMAATITCTSGPIAQPKGYPKTFEQDDLKKSRGRVLVYENNHSKFMLSVSNIFAPKDQNGIEKILVTDAMILTQFQGARSLSINAYDGKILVFFDMEKDVSIVCKRESFFSKLMPEN